MTHRYLRDFLPSELEDCVMRVLVAALHLDAGPDSGGAEILNDWRGFGQQLEEEIEILASALWTALSDQVLFTFALSLAPGFDESSRTERSCCYRRGAS